MIIPSVVSLIVSALFANFGSTVKSVGDGFDDFYTEQRGSVLGAMEIAQEGVFDREGKSIASVGGFLKESDSIQPKRKSGSEALVLPTAIGLAIDCETGLSLWERGAQDVRPIASISKLMTALVFLENNPGWDEVYTLSLNDFREGGKNYILAGEEVRVKDLFYLSLVGSVNTATIALAKSTGLSEEEFVKKMNIKANKLGLKKTEFSDPSGLSRFNISTASEVAKLAKESFSDPDIREAVLRRDYTFETIGRRAVRVESTDKLLDIFPSNGISIIGGKTGYTQLAGSCFVGEFVNHKGRKIISVILGSESIDDRFSYTKELAEWVFNSYNW